MANYYSFILLGTLELVLFSVFFFLMRFKLRILYIWIEPEKNICFLDLIIIHTDIFWHAISHGNKQFLLVKDTPRVLVNYL